ncbi:Olfactory receptor 6S1 [Galemys pyrenaicus]|uniref:Olfactory receptor 6S1 n=1 Tax=Galemys pyrenaicus TaxID=202257 RepID=A0A8J6DIS3_GALPY|nr:Olfactory receptor 6S1 [Galemys pyrenaicus]
MATPRASPDNYIRTPTTARHEAAKYQTVASALGKKAAVPRLLLAESQKPGSLVQVISAICQVSVQRTCLAEQSAQETRALASSLVLTAFVQKFYQSLLPVLPQDWKVMTLLMPHPYFHAGAFAIVRSFKDARYCQPPSTGHKKGPEWSRTLNHRKGKDSHKVILTLMETSKTFSGCGVTEFVLVGFPNLNSTKAELFSVFLLVYLLTLTGNVLIVGVISADTRLQTPMYFFLGNLSCLEILLTSVIIPKMLSNFLSRQHTISFAACITQFYFYFFLGASEFLLLAVMSVDRYLAICHPLHYPLLMNGAVCFRMALACWMGGLLPVVGPTVAVALLPFCEQDAVVQHFFCDSGPLLRLACTNTKKLEETDFVLASLVIVSSLMITAVSYGHIVLAVLRIPSASGRQKAFSTCTSHLMVVTLFYGSAIFLYVRPSQSGSVDTNWAVTVVTTFVTPLLNPFIYALRNERVKEVLKDLCRKVGTRILGDLLLARSFNKKTVG